MENLISLIVVLAGVVNLMAGGVLAVPGFVTYVGSPEAPEAAKAATVCKDLKDDCSGFDKNFCKKESQYYWFMDKYCKKTCGLCGKRSTVSCGHHQASSCAECPQGHGSAWCNGECNWRQGTCQKKTGPVTASPPPGTCRDKDDYCASYIGKTPNICKKEKDNQYYPFMRDNCAKTCGFCKSSASTARPMPATTRPIPPTMRPTPPTMAPRVCNNAIDNCSSYNKSFCKKESKYFWWMEKNCPKYCRLCRG